MSEIIPEEECYGDAAERIALDEEIDHATAIRQLLAIIAVELEAIMVSGWSQEDALSLRTHTNGDKKHDA